MPRSIAAAAAFVACVLGAIYATMMLGCYAHEILGHGCTAAALGGRFVLFHVDPAAHGGAYFDEVPRGLEWIPDWAGIGVNLLFGAAAIAASRVRSWSVGHRALALLAVGATHAAQALGYSLQGAFSGGGDASRLHGLPLPTRVVVIACLAAAYLAMLDWALRRVAVLLDAQFAPPDSRTRRRRFVVSILVPLAALSVSRPPSQIFSPILDWTCRAAIVLALGAWGFVRCGGGSAVATERRPLGTRGAIAWLAAAGVLAFVSATYTADAVFLRPLK